MTMARAPTLIRTFAAPALLAASITLCAASAIAETWPDKPIHIIVPYVAGGNTDSNARLIGAKLSEALGQPVIIDNMPGAGANIGAGAAARAAPDGYTLFQGTGSTHGI